MLTMVLGIQKVSTPALPSLVELQFDCMAERTLPLADASLSGWQRPSINAIQRWS
jgi:hypothetical protein